LLVDPTQPEALAAAMSGLLHDGSWRQELRAKGLTRSAAFTWEVVAQRTLAVYRTVSRS
jgi:O-antigen biosynthesis alpha-1,3-rhamnosyltransferase